MTGRLAALSFLSFVLGCGGGTISEECRGAAGLAFLKTSACGLAQKCRDTSGLSPAEFVAIYGDSVAECFSGRRVKVVQTAIAAVTSPDGGAAPDAEVMDATSGESRRPGIEDADWDEADRILSLESRLVNCSITIKNHTSCEDFFADKLLAPRKTCSAEVMRGSVPIPSPNYCPPASR